MRKFFNFNVKILLSIYFLYHTWNKIFLFHLFLLYHSNDDLNIIDLNIVILNDNERKNSKTKKYRNEKNNITFCSNSLVICLF